MRGRCAEWVGKPKRVVIVATALQQQPRFTVVDPDGLSRNFDTFRYDARVANHARKQRGPKSYKVKRQLNNILPFGFLYN